MKTKPAAKSRQTRQKQAVLDYLLKTKAHPAPEAVFKTVRKKQPQISLGTIYRNLRKLKDQGKIKELVDEKGIKRYDGCLDPHQHFFCVVCGAIDDVSANFLINRRQLKSLGYLVDECDLKIKGRCPRCT